MQQINYLYTTVQYNERINGQRNKTRIHVIELLKRFSFKKFVC